MALTFSCCLSLTRGRPAFRLTCSVALNFSTVSEPAEELDVLGRVLSNVCNDFRRVSDQHAALGSGDGDGDVLAVMMSAVMMSAAPPPPHESKGGRGAIITTARMKKQVDALFVSPSSFITDRYMMAVDARRHDCRIVITIGWRWRRLLLFPIARRPLRRRWSRRCQ